tara:strand:- start:256 stop:528 length:273 start_codon:yes stop_codon:yes gene_type:complete
MVLGLMLYETVDVFYNVVSLACNGTFKLMHFVRSYNRSGITDKELNREDLTHFGMFKQCMSEIGELRKRVAVLEQILECSQRESILEAQP